MADEPPAGPVGWIAQEVHELAAERARSALLRVRELTAALEQAQACILGDTPEDCSPKQARQDTLDKIREALRNG